MRVFKLMNFFKKLFGKKPPEVKAKEVTIFNLYTETKSLYETLKESIDKNPSFSIYTTVPMPVKRYWEFIEVLQPIIDAIKNDLPIDPRDTYVTPVDVTLDEFFLSRQETYLSIRQEFKLMCELVIEFCTLMENVQKGSVNNDYTKRLSMGITNVIYKAGKTLVG